MKTVLLAAVLFGLNHVSIAQTDLTGTYRATGKSCSITIRPENNNLLVSVFAWWGNQMQTHGILEGSCALKNGRCTLKLNPEYDGISPCKSELVVTKSSIQIVFDQCDDFNLPTDFSGNYTKVTSLTTGDYVVVTEKSYFYTERDETTRRKAYLLRGDRMDVQVIYDSTWGYALFTNPKGQVTAGYLKLVTLRTN